MPLEHAQRPGRSGHWGITGDVCCLSQRSGLYIVVQFIECHTFCSTSNNVEQEYVSLNSAVPIFTRFSHCGISSSSGFKVSFTCIYFSIFFPVMFNYFVTSSRKVCVHDLFDSEVGTYMLSLLCALHVMLNNYEEKNINYLK